MTAREKGRGPVNRWRFWIGAAVVFLLALWLLNDILLPFVVGTVIAYFFDPAVGLHPVWIMFALLAGSSLFGFVGVLVAVPVAAVIGVVARHLLDRYRESSLYRGANAG